MSYAAEGKLISLLTKIFIGVSKLLISVVVIEVLDMLRIGKRTLIIICYSSIWFEIVSGVVEVLITGTQF